MTYLPDESTMLDATSAAVLDRLREETERGRLKWHEDPDGYFVAPIGPAEEKVLIRRMFIEATNQIGADPYFVELYMPRWKARFAITGDSEGWQKVAAILDAAFPDGWKRSADQALEYLDFYLPRDSQTGT